MLLMNTPAMKAEYVASHVVSNATFDTSRAVITLPGSGCGRAILT